MDGDGPAAEAGARPPRWLRPAILASPLVFLVHDVEEYVAQRPWLEAAGELIPGVIQARIPSLETYACAFALLVMARLANAITHGVQGMLLAGYVPGLITGLGVVVPFAVLLIRGMLDGRWIRRRWLIPLLVAGFLVQALAIVGSLAAASVLA